MSEPNIHPAAVISSDAKIHPSVRIGPGTIIEAGVHIEENTVIESCVRIHAGTKVGSGNQVFHNVALGTLPQSPGRKTESESPLIIGKDNTIREGVTISRGTVASKGTAIGDRNYIMGNAHLGHDSILGSDNIITQGSIIGGHVQFGNHVVLSGLAAVHQHTRIGDFAMILGLSRVARDVPPYCIAEGNPASITGLNIIGLKRAGYSSQLQNAIREAYEIIYQSGLSVKQALVELRKRSLREKEVDQIISFLENSDRGVLEKR